ncbi:hypothetical protein BH20ACT5_BH20ACT5_14600 [soil metagenome]
MQQWLRVGRVAATAQGLILLPEGAHRPCEYAAAHHLLAPLLDQLREGDLEVLELMSVLGRPATPPMIVPVLKAAAGPIDLERAAALVQGSLDLLVDLGVLTSRPNGYVFRDPLFCDAVRSWLRPSARQGLHRRIAERAHIPSEQRVGHWVAAGEPERAGTALRTPSQEIGAGGDEDTCIQLVESCSLGVAIGAPAHSRIESHERLGDVCVLLRREDEALAAYGEASSMARAHGLPDLARLTGKWEKVAAGLDPTAPDVSVPPDAAPAVQEDGVVELNLDNATVPDWELADLLRARLAETDRCGDEESRAEARLRLASVLFPQRDFEGSRALAEEALAITVVPKIRARAIVEFWLLGALLGHAAAAEGPLAHAKHLADDADDAALTRRLNVLAALTAHDLGQPHADQLLRDAAVTGDLAGDAYWSWVPIRIATERGELDAARLADQRPLPVTASGMVLQMRELASAGLCIELGRTAEAAELLRSVIDEGMASGSLLLLPEAIARLITIEASTDLEAAREHFELLDWAASGDHRFPRENCLRLIARGAVRAAGRGFAAAAAAAASAADVAETSALPFLAAQAHRARAGHLSAAVHWAEARLAVAAAARCHHTAGVTSRGTTGIETRLSLLYSEGVRTGRLSLRRWVDACCSRPARVHGLARKGHIRPGYDADLVVFDPERSMTLSAQQLHSAVDHCTYEGMMVTGVPVVTIARGRVLVQDGVLTADGAQGRLLDVTPAYA